MYMKGVTEPGFWPAELDEAYATGMMNAVAISIGKYESVSVV